MNYFEMNFKVIGQDHEILVRVLEYSQRCNRIIIWQPQGLDSIVIKSNLNISIK